MNYRFNETGSILTVTMDKDDTPVRGDSHLLYALKCKMNKDNYDLIKKRMAKDGHMVSDTQFYLRSRKGHSLMIYDEMYQVRDLAKDYRQYGSIDLRAVRS